MVYWWGRYSYFNIEQIKTSDVEIINAAFDSSGSFGSIVGSKCIVHNTYKCRRRNFCSNPTPIHGPVYESQLKCSYSRKHFSWLPQAVSKRGFNSLSQKVSYDSMMTDPVINGFSPNELRSH